MHLGSLETLLKVNYSNRTIIPVHLYRLLPNSCKINTLLVALKMKISLTLPCDISPISNAPTLIS